MIKLENVSKIFGDKTAVSDISLTVETGETLVLIGTSGCGKTTTLRMLNRLIEPTSGRIFINGRDVRSQAPHELRRNIGYVLQHHGLFPHYTVGENIAVVPRLLGWDTFRIEERTRDLMARLQLDHTYLNAYPSELSGGQQQRVGLARALIADAPLILMDEPFGALDDVTRKSIRKDFMQLEEFRRKTIVLVTHDIAEAFELGDRICIMDRGKIIQQGSKRELLFNPADDFVRNFLAGHLLELQLKMTGIAELAPMVPAAEKTGNLWDLLEDLLMNPQQNNGLTPASLMEAFEKLNRQRHEGTV